MEKFNYLYYFESDAVTVIESKRKDLSTSASLSDVYKWTLFEKNENKFTSLSFRSMSKKEAEEFRSFKEAELRFSNVSGELKYQGQTFSLTPEKPESLPLNFRQQLESYLLSLPQHH